MAHAAQLEFIELLSRTIPSFFNGARVLEIGSLDIKGSIRQYFNNCEYTGIDVAPGRGVDLVCQGQDYKMPDGFYDHVISCECMEHNPYWVETIENMIRLCRPGGLVTMSCASIGRDEHGTTRTDKESSPLTVGIGWTYYKNLSEKEIRNKINLEEHFVLSRFWCNWSRSDLYLVGIKASNTDPVETRGQWLDFENSFNKKVESYNSATRSKLRKYVGSCFGEFGLGLAKKFKSST